MTKTVLLKDLIAKKMTLKENGNRKAEGKVYIPSLEGEVEYEVYKSDIIDFRESGSNEENAQAAVNNLIYTMIKSPNLADKELHKALEVDEPTDVVPLIFTEGEMIDLMNIALEKTGFKTGMVKEVKN